MLLLGAYQTNTCTCTRRFTGTRKRKGFGRTRGRSRRGARRRPRLTLPVQVAGNTELLFSRHRPPSNFTPLVSVSVHLPYHFYMRYRCFRSPARSHCMLV